VSIWLGKLFLFYIGTLAIYTLSNQSKLKSKKSEKKRSTYGVKTTPVQDSHTKKAWSYHTIHSYLLKNKYKIACMF